MAWSESKSSIPCFFYNQSFFYLLRALGQSLHVQALCWLGKLLSKKTNIISEIHLGMFQSYLPREAQSWFHPHQPAAGKPGQGNEKPFKKKVGGYLFNCWLLLKRPVLFLLTLMFKIDQVDQSHVFPTSREPSPKILVRIGVEK